MNRSMLLIAVVLLAAGCGGDSDEDVAKRLESKGTMELMEEASQDQYVPPEDNRLAESQVGMYLKVREREVKIAEVSRKQFEENAKKSEESEGGVAGLMAGVESLGSVADVLTADIRAAQELGYNTAEYQWVKERVMEANADAIREEMTRQMNAMLDTQYAEAKTALDNATSEEEKQMYGQALKGIEDMRSSTAGEAPEPWIAHNRQLLAGHESALKALEAQYAKAQGVQQPGEAVEEAPQE